MEILNANPSKKYQRDNSILIVIIHQNEKILTASFYVYLNEDCFQKELQNQNPDQAQHFAKLRHLVWVYTVCKGYQQAIVTAKEKKNIDVVKDIQQKAIEAHRWARISKQQ